MLSATGASTDPRGPFIDVRQRDTGLRELMDDPDCDLGQLRRTYAVFPVVNGLVAGWRRAYRERIRPLLSADRTSTLLDLGSGGGDLARSLARWARRDGLRLAVTAVDPDRRAHDFASARPADGVVHRCASSGDLVEAGERFDVVVSNHVLHHLDDSSRAAVLADSRALARRLVLHSDIRRSRAAYAGYWVGTLPLARTSFVRVDGLRSIRRSWTDAELARELPAGWAAVRRPPFRVWAVLDLAADAAATSGSVETEGAGAGAGDVEPGPRS
ncbi:class I SAM-dependent methyltransferase [Frigoribacterium sp. VKM Ac-2530]|uniref:class I SAM-dependent methyltransferase n=1 Tax=Frigoribacterium sp. VKM Ac-2530 TaxID=2783822 RepID=UPI00351C802E